MGKRAVILVLALSLTWLVVGCERGEDPLDQGSNSLVGPAFDKDGTEGLGPPEGIDIVAGTGLVAAGVGLVADGSQPGTITIDVPGTPLQALLYWEGQDTDDDPTGLGDILVNGAAVSGAMIGGVTHFFGDAYSSTYRADITNLESITWVSGVNNLTVDGLTFARRNNGVSVVVIYDDGSPEKEIFLRDGNDCAYFEFGVPLNVTEPQTFPR